MIRIRQAQMQQMLDADRSLLRRVVDKRVREQYADVIRGLPADLVDEMIENGIRAARGYGLTRAGDIAGFVLVMFEVVPEFHRHPRVKAILGDPRRRKNWRRCSIAPRSQCGRRSSPRSIARLGSRTCASRTGISRWVPASTIPRSSSGSRR